MKHSHALPLAEHPVTTLWSARPPWADRAIGAAAAAVFLAGVVRAGLVDSEGGPAGPSLAAPAAAASSSKGAVRSTNEVLLPSFSSSSGVQRFTRVTTRNGGNSVSGDLARVAGPVPPASPSNSAAPTSDTTPPASEGPANAPGLPGLPPGLPVPTVPSLPAAPPPIPEEGVTVGPVTADASPTDGATVTVAPGVIAPVTVSFP